LTQNALDDSGPDWSPNGQTIAFVRKTPEPRLYTMTAGGGGQAELNPGVQDATRARWSPSGSALLVQDHGDARVMVLGADGSNLHVALEAINGLAQATWSPSGTLIALWSWWPCGKDDCRGIRTVSPKGGQPTIVTNHPYASSGDDWSPEWRP
jgi:Tol biopolymer transport system component